MTDIKMQDAKRQTFEVAECIIHWVDLALGPLYSMFSFDSKNVED